mmetsp:Transcript_47368/g.150942  ORF Transcript_47368/g.150942 Transcript_47368/m.150942 type:complete len:605 (+) Transcript_47368:635-2449(+)
MLDSAARDNTPTGAWAMPGAPSPGHRQLSQSVSVRALTADGGGATPPAPLPAAAAGIGQPSPRMQHGMQQDVQSIVRREVQVAEARLTAQVTRIQEELAFSFDRAERIRDAAMQRLEQRLLNHEGLQFKLDRRVSELHGVIRGLAEETQVQIRRADSVDVRYRELRHQLEEDLRDKFTDQQDSFDRLRASSGGSEETQRRLGQSLAKLERWSHDHDRAFRMRTGAVDQGFMEVRNRLINVERSKDRAEQSELLYAVACQNADAALNERDKSEMYDERIWAVELQIQDMSQRVEQFTTDAFGEHGWSSRLEEHEVRLAGIRCALEGGQARLAAGERPRYLLSGSRGDSPARSEASTLFEGPRAADELVASAYSGGGGGGSSGPRGGGGQWDVRSREVAAGYPVELVARPLRPAAEPVVAAGPGAGHGDGASRGANIASLAAVAVAATDDMEVAVSSNRFDDELDAASVVTGPIAGEVDCIGFDRTTSTMGSGAEASPASGRELAMASVTRLDLTSPEAAAAAATAAAVGVLHEELLGRVPGLATAEEKEEDCAHLQDALKSKFEEFNSLLEETWHKVSPRSARSLSPCASPPGVPEAFRPVQGHT